MSNSDVFQEISILLSPEFQSPTRDYAVLSTFRTIAQKGLEGQHDFGIMVFDCLQSNIITV